jgi:hypothetical protein
LSAGRDGETSGIRSLLGEEKLAFEGVEEEIMSAELRRDIC